METYGLEKLGILNPTAVYRNLSPAAACRSGSAQRRRPAERQRRPHGDDRQIHGSFA